MKILHYLIIVVTILLLVPTMMNNPVKAGCLGNPDWPDAPCWGCPGCAPDKEKQREEWSPYYQYKGASWMELMKTQMIESMKNGTLEDWVTGNQSNYNAWEYYYLNNQAPFFRSSVNGLNDQPHYIPPPLQQLKTGIEPKDVACKKGLQLFMKASDGSPVCAKPDTASKLVERGWVLDQISQKSENKTRPHDLPTSPNITLAFNGTQSSVDTPFHVKQGQNVTLVVNVTSDPENLPIVLYTEPHIGFTPTNGLNLKLSQIRITTPDTVLLHISIGNDATPNKYRTRVFATTIEGGLGADIGIIVEPQNKTQNPFSADKNGKIDLSKIHLPQTQNGQVDYDKIGYLVSENQFEKMLGARNIQYEKSNWLLIEGMSNLSYPPSTDYCGYVKGNNNEERWFSSSFHYDSLTSSKISNSNPDSCKPGSFSCFCTLQTYLAENNTRELSYFTATEEDEVGNALSKYLGKGNVVNVSNEFVVGKYNLEIDPSLVHYCGKFTWGATLTYFEGYMRNSNVLDFSLAPEKQKLCAINSDAKLFSFDESINGTGK